MPIGIEATRENPLQARKAHCGNSSNGRCWCGAPATPEHAAATPGIQDSKAPRAVHVWREG